MKYFFYLMIILHVLMEGGLGILLMISPATMAPDADISSLAYLFNYGGAGITMALVVAWYWPHRQNAVLTATILGILATFHTAEALAGIQVARLGGDPKIVISHGIIAICFWILWSRRTQLSEA